MAHARFIYYGNNVETYEYEKRYTGSNRRLRKNVKITSIDADLVTSRKDMDSQRRRDNARRAGMAFRRIVSANLSESDHPLFFTFTYSEFETSIQRGYRHIKTFVRFTKSKLKREIKYICVPEFQLSGRLHFHALFWGIPVDYFNNERQTRFFRGAWGQGHVFIKQTDGNEKLASYLSKYMSKTFQDSRLLGQKAYSTSRNILRPYSVTCDTSLVDYLVSDYVSPYAFPLQTKEYNTYWLGRCVYKLFNIKICQQI
jgi:hypothetical protein